MDDGRDSFTPGVAVGKPAPSVASLIERFKAHQATIGVIGLGYVGLPLGCAMGRKGFNVLGFDIDPAKVELINAGGSYISHVDPRQVAALRSTGHLTATADFARLAECDAIILCVPTPLTRQREPDLTFVVRTTESVLPHLRPGQLVVLESTTYPGTTRDVMRPILERNGLKSGRDFFLAYSPEREDPCNASFSTAAIPKVVDGQEALSWPARSTTRSWRVPCRSLLSRPPRRSSSPRTFFRSVNIALVKELKIVY